MDRKPTILIVPGLRDHVSAHWQTLIASEIPRSVTVPPLLQDKLDCSARVAALEATFQSIDGPVVIVAHSAGVMITVQWQKRLNRVIQGALLAAPPDFEMPMPAGYSSMETLEANGWFPVPKARLPFPSIVAASRNDPLASFERVSRIADAWGSQLVDLGNVGHLNPKSGFGPWPRAHELIAELTGLSSSTSPTRLNVKCE